jgi:phosphinothricin acetyltransferase
MKIINATLASLAACQSIYAHHVLHGTGTFEEAPPSLEELTLRHQAITSAGQPWFVACDGAEVLGYAYYGPFRARAAYRFTAEDSVYVHPAAQGRGVGRALLTALLTHAQEAGKTQMLALIGDSGNAGSIGLHKALGFTDAGIMRRVGCKFGRWLDVVVLQKEIRKEKSSFL